MNFLFRILPVYKYRIHGSSMIPTLRPDTTILVSRISYLITTPQVNDIVAAKDPRDSKILIKRITRIKNGKYFIEGDNKHHSTDSREFGMITKDQIIGKVLF